MVEILSQEEIEALLSSLNSPIDSPDAGGSAAPGSASPVFTSTGDPRGLITREDRRKSECEPYDFRRPDKFSKEQLRSVQVIHETFARLFATSFSAHLRVSCHVDLLSVDQIPYDEYMRSLTSSIINVFSMSPLSGQGLLEIEYNIVLSMFERLVGGTGNMVKAGMRLTEIEKALTESLVKRALKELKAAWEGVAQFNPVQDSMETQPQFIQIMPQNDIVISTLFELKFGDLRGAMSLCIPYVTLKPVMAGLSTQRWFATRNQSGGNQAALAKRIETTPVTCVCRLGAAHIRVEDLANLQVGDTITLDRKRSDEVELLIGNRVKFRGKLGRAGRKVAIHINRIAADDYCAAA